MVAPFIGIVSIIELEAASISGGSLLEREIEAFATVS